MSGGFAVLLDDVEDLAQDLARFALADAPASCSDRDASGSDGDDDGRPRPRGADIVRVAPSTVAPPERPLTSTPPRVILLDDPGSCADAMRELIARGEPCAVDFEGVALSRTGAISLAQVAPPNGPVYLVDVACMGAAAFDEGRLGELLGAKHPLKLVFDCRGDADALHHQFGVRMRGVFDVQVAFCLKKDVDHGGKRGAYLMGLRKALKECPGLDDEARHELDAVKSAGASLFAPELGGSYDAWTKRPMHPDLVKYAAADVTYLHHMHRTWRGFCGEKKMAAVTERRMRERIESPEGLEQGTEAAKRRGSRREKFF
jgi:exonuclease 3'-5' domain-containing protein 1